MSKKFVSALQTALIELLDKPDLTVDDLKSGVRSTLALFSSSLDRESIELSGKFSAYDEIFTYLKDRLEKTKALYAKNSDRRKPSAR